MCGAYVSLSAPENIADPNDEVRLGSA